jgi:hypothetical protein
MSSMMNTGTRTTWIVMGALLLNAGACALDMEGGLDDESFEAAVERDELSFGPSAGVYDVQRSRPGFRLADTDGDGFPDIYDVCRYVSDGGQRDMDDDGVGDACDCSDGFRGPLEDGIDCGGPCAPCSVTCTNGARYAPSDTPCTSAAPTDPHRVDLPWTNDDLELVCQIYEVCDPELDFVVEEAHECCDDLLSLSAERSAHDATCTFALDHARDGDLASWLQTPETWVRRCMALYIIRGVGRDDLWMAGHDNGPVAAWETENGAYAGAGALVNEIGTGICRHYATVTTTLLRKAGLPAINVGGSCDGAHCFNTVRLPGDIGYHVVDTDVSDINLGGLPSGYPYCSSLDPENWCFDGERPNGQPCDGTEANVRSSEGNCYNGLSCGRDNFELPAFATPFGMIVGC